MTQPRILATVDHDRFVGRDAALRELVQHPSAAAESQALIVMAPPDGGAPELLRQAYDRLFSRRGDPTPLYFAFNGSDAPRADTARRFFQTLMQQFIGYRRVNPALCKATVTFNDLLDLSLPSDYELIANLIEAFEREQSSEIDFINFCFGLPGRLRAAGRSVYPLIDCTGLGPFREDLLTGQQLARQLATADLPFALAILRRQANELIHNPNGGGWEAAAITHLDRLSDASAAHLVELMARQYQIDINDATRDLLVQQLNGSPLFITEFMHAARRNRTRLNTFLACQRLYVDELLGGGIKRHFDRILKLIAPGRQSSKTMLRILYESALADSGKSSLWAWKKRLGMTGPEFEHVLDALHVFELVNSSGSFIEMNPDSYVWLDYLRAHYRVEVAGEQRAKVVAEILLETLERAPQTMTRKYRRQAAVGLADVVPQFNCQTVPASLFHYQRFAAAYKGEDDDTIESGLDADTDLMQLPQVIQTAAAAAYSNTITCERERCLVAHAFAKAEYVEGSEIVWIAAEIDAKVEASREITAEWCDRLVSFGRECGFDRIQIWLVAPEGFSAAATELLKERAAFGSSRQQVRWLARRLESEPQVEQAKLDEYEMVIPMGADTELIAAHAVEKIARRVNFQPEAINQIKTALVEACINAAEHSLSPDRKIYQRFIVEDDKLIVTVASRGVLPAQFPANGQDGKSEENGGKGRRGWGLKLIKSLMDEVEFERVDDGTQLRMTKYVK
jgi:serine/threonine-protein kinase RsbW